MEDTPSRVDFVGGDDGGGVDVDLAPWLGVGGGAFRRLRQADVDLDESLLRSQEGFGFTVTLRGVNECPLYVWDGNPARTRRELLELIVRWLRADLMPQIELYPRVRVHAIALSPNSNRRRSYNLIYELVVPTS